MKPWKELILWGVFYICTCWLMLLLLNGCSVMHTLEPNALPIEFDHVSHLTQHEPFTNRPTAYGSNEVMLGAKWQPLPRFSVTLSDGITLGSTYTAPNGVQWHGSTVGPREVFTGRIAYEIPLK